MKLLGVNQAMRQGGVLPGQLSTKFKIALMPALSQADLYTQKYSSKALCFIDIIMMIKIEQCHQLLFFIYFEYQHERPADMNSSFVL